ncbi:2'-deoxycytidine 5'-triphosphate deaminase [Desulfonatronospira sp.]|uniref:2'-deoxycytidine 5'-triphosphate deaminase domain-containing protein n=1 Tax=Desulfonatronospira sp. TaxID=1962951 RepID=UPI00343EDAC3
MYLVELDCSLYLPENINGRATGRSSIGRLDVITRLLTDRSTEYDIVESGYEGPLYLLVLPQTFSLIASHLKTGLISTYAVRLACIAFLML